MAEMSSVKRPALYWQGSKWRIAPWVISFFPSHKLYVEPFGGSAAVLLRKAPAQGLEVWNDLHGDAVNFFRTLRDPVLGPELARMCRLTPHARAEWEASKATLRTSSDQLERAWAFWTRSRLSVGARVGNAGGGSIGFRYGTKSGKNEARATATAADGLEAVSDRLRRVVIEQKDAFALFPQYDTAETLFYADPPYAADYAANYNTGTVDHNALLDVLEGLQGYVALSGYPSELYASRLKGWHMETHRNTTVVNTPRTECLWLSPRTWEALQAEREAV